MIKKEKDKQGVIPEKIIFGSFLIITLLLIANIPQMVRGDPPSIDAGNYVRPSDDRIAYYNFNYVDSGYIADDSGKEKSGELKGGCSLSTNERDNNINGNAALLFDGINDYVQIDNSDDFDFNEFAITALIYTSEESGDDLIICSKCDDPANPDDGFKFYLDEGKLNFTIWNGGTESSVCDSDGDDLRDDDWHFVAFERHSDRYKLYIDPTSGGYGMVENVTGDDEPGDNTGYFYIGKFYNSYFEGSMDFLYAYELPHDDDFDPFTLNRMWGNKNIGYWPLDEGVLDEDKNFVNDMVRYDYHSYGTVNGDLDSVNYISSKPNGVPGTHSLQFTQGEDPGYVCVTDDDNYFGFTGSQYEVDLYIEFMFWTESCQISQMLIEKWDWTNVIPPQANGYRIYLEYNPGLMRVEAKFDLGYTNIASVTSNTQIYNGYWYHVWAWVTGGTMFFHVSGYGTPSTQSGPASYGIGSTSSNPLLFALGYPSPVTPYTADWPFLGALDDIVIGKCPPL